MPFDIELLDSVRLIVCHRNPSVPCPDGVASAILLRDALPDATVRFATHGVELLEIPPQPGTIFCDIAPPKERMIEWAAAGAIVLDHHRGSREIVESFANAGHGVFADEEAEPGVSGAVLAYREVWKPLKGDHMTGRRHVVVERFATLAGIRDTWQRDHIGWADACAQAEALTFWPWSKWPVSPFIDGMSREMGNMLNLGYILLEKREARTRELLSRGYRTTTKAGTKVLVIPSCETSDAAEAAEGIDLLVGFDFRLSSSADGPFDVPMLQLSLRSRGAFDCAAFCKANGGGGHTRAAGCHVELSWEDKQPFNIVVDALDVWEQHGRGSF